MHVSVRNATDRVVHHRQNVEPLRGLLQHLRSGDLVGRNSWVHLSAAQLRVQRAPQVSHVRLHPAAEIADQLGYTNVSHFIDAFKKKYGVTPKKFEMSLT